MFSFTKSERFKKNFFLGIFIFLLGVAVVLRVAAFSWNSAYLHDNSHYGRAAESLAQHGNFKISSSYSTGVAHSYSVSEKGGEYLDHNPLWPILGSFVVLATGLPGPRALMVWSLLFGTLTLVLVYLVVAEILGREAGLVALALSVFSYELIDFSGNGSFYIFQAFLYLLFIYALISKTKWSHPVVLGAITGCALLTVHQSIALVATYVVYIWHIDWNKKKQAFTKCVQFLAVAIALYLPWGLRNHYFLGNFFPPADTYYIWDKLGVEKVLQGDITKYQLSFTTLFTLIKREITKWFPDNTYYINRQLFILVPVTYIAALFTGIETIFNVVSKNKKIDRLVNVLPVILILFFHILISAAWPITKFRYFVSMIPLVVILGVYYLYAYLQNVRLRNLLIAFTVTITIVLSTITYLGARSHTSYYGGILTTDPFGKQWELNYIDTYQGLLLDAE